MSSNATVFNLQNFTVTKKPVPNPGLDCNVPGINTSASSGTRITGVGFLQAANLASGQDQVLVHSGDQTVKVDKNRNTWIDIDEEYVNHAKLDHQIIGDFTEKYHATATSEFVGLVKITYDSHLKTTELQGDTKHRNINETVFFNGNQTTIHTGNRTRAMAGVDINVATPLRLTSITGMDMKAIIGLDNSYALFKNSTSLIDSKAALIETKLGCAKGIAEIAALNGKGVLARVGALCLKGALSCIGMIRW